MAIIVYFLLLIATFSTCEICDAQFDPYFWQLHAKGYCEVKTGNTDHEIHQGWSCKNCIKNILLVDGKQKCPWCRNEIVCVRNTTDNTIFYSLASLLVYEYSYGGQLANNLPTWINSHFSNFAIVISGHYFIKILAGTDSGASFVFWLIFDNYTKVIRVCFARGVLIILCAINILSEENFLLFEGTLSDFKPVIGYPSLALFISQIYTPKKFAFDSYLLPVPISNSLIVVGGHNLLKNFIIKFSTYEFGYIGRLIDKIMNVHRNLIVFIIELTLGLNLYEFSTLLFVLGCFFLMFTLINKAIK